MGALLSNLGEYAILIVFLYFFIACIVGCLDYSGEFNLIAAFIVSAIATAIAMWAYKVIIVIIVLVAIGAIIKAGSFETGKRVLYLILGVLGVVFVILAHNGYEKMVKKGESKKETSKAIEKMHEYECVDTENVRIATAAINRIFVE